MSTKSRNIGPIQDVVPFSIVAIGTILVHDWLHMLDDEVEYVWKARQNLGTILFYLNRYTPFIDTFISLDLLIGKHSPEACERNFKVVLWLIVLGTLISESILCLRTYALWERRRSVGIALMVTYGVIFAAGIGVVSLEAQSLKYEEPPVPGEPGCYLKSASAIVFIDYALVLVAETIMVVLTIIKAVQHLRHTRSPLVVTLYRDGILFYFMLLTITVANVIVPLAGPSALTNWLATPQRVLHSILCTRVLLFILKSRSRTSFPTTSSSSRPPSTPHVLSSIATMLSPSAMLDSVPAHWDGPAAYLGERGDCEGRRSRSGGVEPDVVELDELVVRGTRGEVGVDVGRVSGLRYADEV